MTSERDERSFERETIDRKTAEECPTLEIARDRDATEGTSGNQYVRTDTPPSGDDTPATLTMGWSSRDDDLLVSEDTNPEMLIWEVDEDEASLRETIRDARAYERTQIIDMDEVMGAGQVPLPSDGPALTDLAGAVGHELNNPLTTCVGYLRQISDMVSNEDDQMAHMVERLGRNLNRIHSIVGELEMLAAESTERQTKVDLATVVEKVHRQLSSFLDADVELDLRPAPLLTDRPRIYQLAYIMLAAHMLDDEIDQLVSVRVSPRTVGACLEITAPKKPQGSLRLDLLGILRRETLDGSTPLGLAAQLTRTMGGTWHDGELSDGHRVSAVLPRRCPVSSRSDSSRSDSARPESSRRHKPRPDGATRRHPRGRTAEGRPADFEVRPGRGGRPTDEA